MPDMYYLDVTLKIVEEPKPDISPVFLKRHVTQSLKQLFGEEGAKSRVDIVKYNPKELSLVLRCQNQDYVRLRASLSLARSYEGKTCFYNVERATQNPLSLATDSRKFNH